MCAVLCTARISFAMDNLPCDQYPPSPGKITSDEDLKALLQVTRSHSPEDFPSASSTPIPADASQEGITVPAATASPEPAQTVQNFQAHFKQWIDTENIAAFRGFLKEHYDDAEEYISDELVALALQKKCVKQSEKAQEIYEILNHLNLGRKNNLGGMEKINLFTNNSDKVGNHAQDSQDGTCEANMLVIDHCRCMPLSPAYSESETLTVPNFFQQKSVLNIVLRDLIKEQKLDEIFKLVYELTKYDDCDLAEIISDKTREVAYRKMSSKETKISKMIYSIVSDQADDISASESDTTAESLERVFTTELDKIKLSKKGERAMVKSKLLTCIENSDLKGLNKLCDTYECEAQIAKHISQDMLKSAEVIRDRVAEVYEFIDHETAYNAREVWLKLHQVVHDPRSVVYILSDEEGNGPVYSELELDQQRMRKHISDAFSLSTLESIVGSAKAEKILQLLKQEKKNQKHGELDWVSPVSSPSEGLREYLGSFKSESLSD